MKEKILKLRSEGKSYKEIQNVLGCSKSTISYHCGEGQKEKSLLRLRNHKKTLNAILKRKKDNFSFLKRRHNSNKDKRVSLEFSSKDFQNKLLSNPICYLTGRQIDLYQPKTYNCDHIVPVSKGGGCSMDNLGLACKEANLAKGDLFLDDFIQLCKDVLVHNGYVVKKNFCKS